MIKVKSLTIGKGVKIAIATVVILIAIAILSIGFLIDIQWFKEVGYLNVFMTKIIASAVLIVPIFLLSFIALFIYFKSMKKTILGIVGYENSKIYNIVTNLINLVGSFVLGALMAANNWRTILEFINAENFGVNDPIFNLDIAFYIFKLPILNSIYNAIFTILLVMVVITFIVYLSTSLNAEVGQSRVIHLNNRGEGLIKFAGKQLAIICAITMILFAAKFVLKSFDLVYSPRGVAYGASYTDVKVTLLFYRIISIVSIIGAIIVAISIMRNKFKPIIACIGIITGLIILQPIIGTFVQQVIVKSNEMEFEKPYIEFNIAATKSAYGIDNIEVKEFNPSNDLNSEKLARNEDIINNLKVNSAEPVLNFYKQVQLIKNYYTFNDVDTSRYNINGDYTQVFVAPREINTSEMNDAWQNKHLRYTHGYGLAMSEVNQVTKEGQPSFVMRDIPTINSTDINIENPRIYFGESTNNYAIVNTDVVEFDYPDGELENEFKYDGTAGIQMNLLNKLVFALEYNQPKIIFSGAINKNSKILINRNIIDRAKTIVPFLTFDGDPYPIIHDDKILWVLDAYTTSNKYPFSEPYKGINYIRNSVKVTIDAYNGDINFYLADDKDPIIKTYSKIFKDLFKPMSELPEGIKEHFRYPQDMFNLQTEVLAKYHINDAIKLFTKEDLWDVSGKNVTTQNENTQVESAEQIKRKTELLYLMTRLHGEENIELVLFEYFNMRGKQNMVSLLGARMDGDNYGELVMYKFPQQRAIYSPDLFKNRMMQDPEISKEISLWAGKGSEVVYGDIVILPIEDSLLYMNTIYLKAEAANGMPEMKRVVLSNGDEIVIAENVEKALEKLFGYSSKFEGNNTSTENENSENANTSEGIISGSFKDAAKVFNEAVEAQKSGDWAKYGELINKLGEILNNEQVEKNIEN